MRAALKGKGHHGEGAKEGPATMFGGKKGGLCGVAAAQWCYRCRLQGRRGRVGRVWVWDVVRKVLPAAARGPDGSVRGTTVGGVRVMPRLTGAATAGIELGG